MALDAGGSVANPVEQLGSQRFGLRVELAPQDVLAQPVLAHRLSPLTAPHAGTHHQAVRVFPAGIARQQANCVVQRGDVIALAIGAIGQPGEHGQETGPQPFPLDDNVDIGAGAEITAVQGDRALVMAGGGRLFAGCGKPIAGVDQGVEAGDVGAIPSRGIEVVATVGKTTALASCGSARSRRCRL